MFSAKLLFKLTNQTSMNLLVIGKLRNWNVDDDGFLIIELKFLKYKLLCQFKFI